MRKNLIYTIKMFNNKIAILAFFFLLFSYASVAQESKVKINYEGKDVTSLKHAWAAQWITHPTSSTLDYNVFLFRREFELEKKPNQFIIYVSADNRYKLFVNGKKVAMGPARGDINNWRYETLDISSFLTSGKNIIAAEVVNFGEFRHAAQPTFQTAFILQGDASNPVDINTRPREKWKVLENEAYSYTPFVSDSLGGYYAAGPGDILDANKYPWGWNEKKYDDSHWQVPRPATVEFAVGRGFLFGSTWFLVPRTIPMMETTKTQITKVVRSKEIKVETPIFQNKSITIPAHTTASILLDQTHHTIGYPEMIFSGGKKSKVKITYAEALFYKKSKTRTAHGGWKKGHRNQNYNDKEIRGYYDIVYPDGGTKRKYTPLAMRTYRFVQLDITTQDEALTIDDFYGIYTAYPFEEKAKFNVADQKLNEIWEVAWRTLRNSSAETFIDPYYEQLQYIGDSRVQSMVAIYVANDDQLMRKAIRSFDDSRLPNGLTASRFPSYIVQIIPTYSLFWVDMIHDYYWYRNDPQFLEQFLPGMVTVLDWFERHIDNTGMLANLEWWNFTDWTKGFQNGIPPGTDDGHSANISLQYVYALQHAVPVFRYFGKNELADKYEKLAISIQRAVLQNCFSPSKQLIAERPEKDVFSQHTNIFAVLTETFPAKDSKKIMEKVMADSTLIQTSIYFKFYLARALQKAEMGERYFELLEPWEYMLSQGMTTFGETDKNPRSDCHGWSATPCFEFLHTIAGIQPTAAGFKEVLIAPHFGKLDQMEVSFPHPAGEIKLNLKKKGDKVKGDIDLPKGVNGKFRYNGKTIELKEGCNKIKY